MPHKHTVYLEHTELIYLLELIKAAEEDNNFLSACVLPRIGTYGMKHVGLARKALEAVLLPEDIK